MGKKAMPDNHFKDDYQVEQVDKTKSVQQITVQSAEPLNWPLWTKVFDIGGHH